MSELERRNGVGNRALVEEKPRAVLDGRGDDPRFPLVQRTVVSGLPVFWAKAPGPFAAGLVFRVGRADEQATTAGITHLVEHLALPAGRVAGIDFNGAVSSSTTWFWASGDREGALDLLTATVRRLAALPERLETERGILLTEAAARGHGSWQLAAALRFGPRGHGLIGYEEYGLRWLGLQEASAWADEHFNSANVAIWMTGEPPAELELELPAGRRSAAPEPKPILGIDYPSVFPFAGGGGASVAMLMPRSSAASMAAAVAVERARERLRYEHGVSYSVDMGWEPLTGEVASCVLTCDCQHGNERQAARLLRGVLDELAAAGPTEAELERELAERERRFSDPAAASGLAYSAASDELLRDELQQAEELLVEAAEVTPVAAQAALQTGVESALLLTADPKWQPEEHWSVFPLYSVERLEGRRYTPAGAGLRRPRKAKPTLFAGDEGLTYLTGNDALTVRYSECELVESWPGGTRVLIAADAMRLVVNPSAWQNGDRLVAEIDGRVPGERVVPMNRPVEQRADALADELRHRLLSGEVRRASGHLDFAETPIDVVGASVGDTRGLLTLTARRLLFTSGGRLHLDLPLHAIDSVQKRGGRWPQGPTLVLRTEGHTLAFRDGSPRGRLDAFVNGLEHAARAAGSPLVVEPSPRWTRASSAYVSLVAVPLSLALLFPLASFENVKSHANTIILSVVSALLGGGTCAGGVRLGLLGRRHARDGGGHSWAALFGIVIGALGLLLWLTMAVAVPLSEW